MHQSIYLLVVDYSINNGKILLCSKRGVNKGSVGNSSQYIYIYIYIYMYMIHSPLLQNQMYREEKRQRDREEALSSGDSLPK